MYRYAYAYCVEAVKFLRQVQSEQAMRINRWKDEETIRCEQLGAALSRYRGLSVLDALQKSRVQRMML